MAKVYAEISEGLVWAVYLDVPDEIADDPVAIKDYVYDNWGESEKDMVGGIECEIVRLDCNVT